MSFPVIFSGDKVAVFQRFCGA